MGFIRKTSLTLLRKLNLGTIKIKHHHTKTPFYLDAFTHKGYWYHGKKREQDVMALFEKIVDKGNFVVEAGAHIGYISQFFSKLVGDNGKVVLFEPGENNISYLKQNITNFPNISLVEKAVSDTNGIASFYLDSLTGQNNSLLSDYDLYNDNVKFAGISTEKKVTQLETITIDTYLEANARGKVVDFVKIDVEGAEYPTLKGMNLTLTNYKPSLMIEATESIPEIFKFLKNNGTISRWPLGRHINELTVQ
jgi:FkbM family methyltransferase